MNAMKVLKSTEEIKTPSNMNEINCKCGHSDEIYTLKSKITFLEYKILKLEANQNSKKQGPFICAWGF